MTESVYGGAPVLRPSRVPQRFVDLRALDDTGMLYSSILSFAQRTWPHLRLTSDLDFHNLDGHCFQSHKVAKQLQFVYCNSLRYGSAASSRTPADQYAIMLANGARFPVRILWHFQIEVLDEEPQLCSVVARLDTSNIPVLPWALQYLYIGSLHALISSV